MFNIEPELETVLGEMIFQALIQQPQKFQDEFLVLIALDEITPTREMIESDDDSVEFMKLTLTPTKFCVAYAGVGVVFGHYDKPKYVPTALGGDGYTERMAYTQSRIDRYEILS